MGLDFIRRAAHTFHKGLDRRRIELATPTLFTQPPTSLPRTYAAEVRGGQTLTAGEQLSVRLDGQRVLALRGLDPVAIINSPPVELMDALSASHGEACGVVNEVHDIAHIAEISVC